MLEFAVHEKAVHGVSVQAEELRSIRNGEPNRLGQGAADCFWKSLGVDQGTSIKSSSGAFRI
jgi:hypothetical protein